MEDILQSIKRIIEDDTGAEAKPAAPAGGEPDVLDLTQVVGADGSVADIATVPTPKISAPAPAPAEDIIQSIDNMFADEKPAEPAPGPAAKSAAMPALKPEVMEDGLMSDNAAKAAAAALKPIAETAHKDYSVPRIPSPGLRSGNTVEDLILESLRPMLKAWLDEHLPTIVQKIVEKEVKRIVTFHQD
jgi:hypothetical protein